MTSILTSSAGTVALQTLQSVNSNLAKTQAAVSSGLRVASSADNAAYWSIATTMRSDNFVNTAVSDALGLGAATADTAYQGMNSAIDIVSQLQSKLVAAQAEGVDKAKVQSDISQLQGQLKTIVSAASFSGQNWLQGDPSVSTDKSIIAGFARVGSAGGNVSLQRIGYSLDGSSILIDNSGNTPPGGLLDKVYDVAQNSVDLSVTTNGTSNEVTVGTYSENALTAAGANFDENNNHANVASGADQGDYIKVQGAWVKAVDVGSTGQTPVVANWGVDTSAAPAASVTGVASVLTADVTTMDSDQIQTMLKGVDKSLTDMTSAAANLGSISARIDLQTDFISKRSDTVTAGIGRLVDADMEKESSKLTALQTQQQLAIQSLSIANSSTQTVLSLFHG